METTSSQRSAGASARNVPGKLNFGVAMIVAGLLLTPMLARPAQAQRPATIQASANVVNSYISSAFRPDSTPAAAAHVPTPPATRQIRIDGVGVVDVRSGAGMEVRVASSVADSRLYGPTVRVSVSYLGN